MPELRQISIPALREEGDSTAAAPSTSAAYFYPRPPRGGRPTPNSVRCCCTNFYPRPPRGGRPLYRYKTSLSA